MKDKNEAYRLFLKQIEEVKALDYKPSLLLHVCCAPCSSYPLLKLMDLFNITVDYYNPNIYPYEEFRKRADEEKAFLKKIGQQDARINYIEDCYDNNEYNEAVKGLEHLGEMSQRCYHCYELRMRHAAKKAQELHCEYFSTVMSISPYKSTAYIFDIGQALEKEYGVKFLASDFKKEEGYKKSIEYSQEYGLYRQDYCGCIYSKEEHEQKCAQKTAIK